MFLVFIPRESIEEDKSILYYKPFHIFYKKYVEILNSINTIFENTYSIFMYRKCVLSFRITVNYA